MKILIIAVILSLSTSVAAENKSGQNSTQRSDQQKTYFDFPLGVKVTSREFLFTNKRADTSQLERYLKQTNLQNKAFLIIPASFSVQYQYIIKILKQHSVAENQIQVRFDLSKPYSLSGDQLLLKSEEFTAVTHGCNTNQIGCSTQSNYLLMLDNPRDLYHANKSQNLDARSVLETLKRLENRRPSIGNNQSTRGD